VVRLTRPEEYRPGALVIVVAGKGIPSKRMGRDNSLALSDAAGQAYISSGLLPREYGRLGVPTSGWADMPDVKGWEAYRTYRID